MFFNIRKTSIAVTFLLLLGLFSCQNDNEQSAPNVSDISIDLEVRRFEKDLFSLDTSNLESELTALQASYPDFGNIYFNNILQSGGINGDRERHLAFMKHFLNNYAVQKLQDTINLLFQEFSPFEAGFRQAFQYLKYYFPEIPTPDITTFISEFGVGTFIYKDQSLAVGLDFFIGESFPYQAVDPTNPNFSSYLTRTFNKDHLVPKTIKVLVEDLVGQAPKRRFLDMMIHNGKKLYVLDHLLPFAPDSVKLEVTAEQVAWLNNNEKEMWAYFLQEDLIYSSEWTKIAKFVSASPNSPGMPPEAPGRTANWIGWQIVKAYMKQFPDKTMRDLIDEKDVQQILDTSKYKPKR